MTAEVILLEGRRPVRLDRPAEIVIGGPVKDFDWALKHADVILSMPSDLKRDAIANLIREVAQHG